MAKRRESARPRPRVPPVTSATLPLKSCMQRSLARANPGRTKTRSIGGGSSLPVKQLFQIDPYRRAVARDVPRIEIRMLNSQGQFVIAQVGGGRECDPARVPGHRLADRATPTCDEGGPRPG